MRLTCAATFANKFLVEHLCVHEKKTVTTGDCRGACHKSVRFVVMRVSFAAWKFSVK